MALANSPARYGSVAMTLHWLIAGALILNICLGVVMSEVLPDRDITRLAILQLHKSVGLTVLTLSLARLVWRLANPVPPLPSSMPARMRIAARATHFLLYFVIIAIPLTGWALVSSSRTGSPTIYFGLFHWPHISFLANMPSDQKAPLHRNFNRIHAYLPFSTIPLVLIHVAGAFYHQRRGDDVLRRMLPELRKLPEVHEVSRSGR
ncbi:MAG: cytochrome b [Rhizomicrobium sp.]